MQSWECNFPDQISARYIECLRNFKSNYCQRNESVKNALSRLLLSTHPDKSGSIKSVNHQGVRLDFILDMRRMYAHVRTTACADPEGLLRFGNEAKQAHIHVTEAHGRRGEIRSNTGFLQPKYVDIKVKEAAVLVPRFSMQELTVLTSLIPNLVLCAIFFILGVAVTCGWVSAKLGRTLARLYPSYQVNTESDCSYQSYWASQEWLKHNEYEVIRPAENDLTFG